MNVLIAIPCMDSVPVQFCQSLACLNRPSDGNLQIQFNVGSLIYDSRNKIAIDAIKKGADYVMWFDSDMAFPPDVLDRMLEHMKTKDIVSGLYFRRAKPYTPVLFKKLKLIDDTKVEWEGYDDYPNELFQIDGAGFGCICMKTSVLADMFAKCGTCFSPIGNTGEDCAFCIRANELGYKIYCDPTIQLGHCGHMVVTEGFYKAFSGTKED